MEPATAPNAAGDLAPAPAPATASARVKRKSIPFWRKSLALNLGIIIVAFVFFVGFFPGLIAPYNPNTQNADLMLQAPSAAHILGTDNYGRDILSRVIWATRADLQIGLIGTAIPFVFGTLVGLLAGYYGGVIDQILMRLVDIVVAFPFIVLVIAIIAFLGPGIYNLYMAISLVGWVPYARIIRGEVLVAKNLDYVSAARVLGYSDWRIILRHILPNVLSSSIVYTAADVVFCMLAGASMGFLGLGVQPPTPEWGQAISEGRVFIARAWWLSTFPGFALVFVGTGFSLLGDGLSDLLRTKGR